MSDETWVERHRRAWARKPGMRWYQTHEVFDRLIGQMVDGPSLEVGAGPGLMAERRRCDVVSDLTASPYIDLCADLHRLPFADGTFGNVVGVDILHHLERPAAALNEIARVLRPGGRLVLVEPWPGALSVLVFRLLHHEACARVADPWRQAFPAGKEPLDGNTMLARQLLWERRDELAAHVPLLQLRHVEAFGALSCLLTGGFQDIGAPGWMVRPCVRLEAMLPQSALRMVSLRALFVLEKRQM